MTDKPPPATPPADKPNPEAKPALDAKPAAAEDRLHPILSNEEFKAAQLKARKRVEELRKTAAMKSVEEAEIERLRLQEGLVSGLGALDEIVNITIDLAEYAPYIQINMPMGPIYWHGQTYTVPRHVANTLADMMFRTHQHQAEIDGKSTLSAYQRKRNTVISPIRPAQNAPGPMA